MILSYKASMAGPYHIDEGLCCQDAFAIERGSGAFIHAAVADGLGSELYSDIGSAVAAETAVHYCAQHIEEGMPFEAIRQTMKHAMVQACKAVFARAGQDGHDPDQYDTTLCMCAYDGQNLYYAQSGDSGLIVLQQDGHYRRVTTQQRDADGCVFPLCWGSEKWEFGLVEAPVSAVMLMTDGVFEQLCPPIMRKKEPDINIPLARKFLDRFDCDPDALPELEGAACAYLENYSRDYLDDDKTIVVLINTDRPAAVLAEDYYAAPDWAALRAEAERALWPDLALDPADAGESPIPADEDENAGAAPSEPEKDPEDETAAPAG